HRPFQLDTELHRAQLEQVSALQFALALDLLIVDKGAVGTVEIADKYLAVLGNQDAVSFTDHRAGWTQMTLRIPTDQELGKLDGNRLPRRLPFGHDDQAQLHETPSFR